MGLPNILIEFKAKANTAVKRGERGIVCVMIVETTKGIHKLESINEIPEAWTATNKDYVSKAFFGGEVPVKCVYVICTDTITNGLVEAEKLQFDYMAGTPDITSEDALKISVWVKEQRDNKQNKVKAILPNTAGSHEGIINFVTNNIKVGSKTYTTSQYCSRIAGLLAGTPLNISATYSVLNEVTDVPRLSKAELDALIDEGKFVIFHDGIKVKVGRAVNSLTSISGNKSEDYKSIKIIDIMDLINNDLRRTCDDVYIAKFPNNYDNKCLLIVAIQGYLEQLKNEELLDKNIEVGIDMDRQISYIKGLGIDTTELSEQEIKEYNTSKSVFLYAKFQILNAIEDVSLVCYI